MVSRDFFKKLEQTGYVVDLELVLSVIEWVLHKKRLQEEIQSAMEAMDQRNRELILLHQAGQEMMTSLDSQEILGRLLRAGPEVIETEGCSIWLWDEAQEGWLVCRAISHYGQHKSMVDLRLRPGQGIAGWVAQREKGAIVSNVTEDSRFTLEVDKLLGFQTISLLAVPLRGRGGVIGVLELVNKLSGEPFTEDDQPLAEMLAASAAIALANAQLFSDVRHLANTDELTGLHNRRYFFSLADHEFKRAQRYKRQLSAIMADIDLFKAVNDTYGHAVGDRVLQVIAERLSENIRDVDVLGRYGGEEFAMILPETNLQAACEVAERLRTGIAEKPIPTDQGNIQVTISLGVARVLKSTQDVGAMLNDADLGMYKAKHLGRNRIEVMKKERDDPSP